MANLGLLEDVWRRAMDTNLRYYGAVGRLTADYLKDLLTVLAEFRPSQPAGRPPAAGVQKPDPTPASARQQTGVMVLESEAGATALGVFLVENNLGREVSARVVASAFVDPTGREVRPALTFDPEVVTLRPGEQLLVRVMAAIDEALEPEVRYRGELTIPELTGTQIPIILRRRPSRDKPADQAPSGASASAAPKKSRSNPRSRPTKAEGSPGAGNRKG